MVLQHTVCGMDGRTPKAANVDVGDAALATTTKAFLSKLKPAVAVEEEEGKPGASPTDTLDNI